MAADPPPTDPRTPPAKRLREILRTRDARRIVLVRGLVMLAAGAVSLLQPRLAEASIGIGLVVISLLELVVHRRSVGQGHGLADYRDIRVLVGLLAGVALLVSQANPGFVAARILAIAVGVLGLVDLASALTDRDRSDRTLRLARGLLFIALAGVLILVPTVAWSAMLLVGAVALVTAGSLTVGIAVREPDVDLVRTDRPAGIVGLMGDWMRHRDIGSERRAEMMESYAYDPPVADKLSRFTILLGLAAVIAAVGLISNSVAVIIGAMIIAPLMVPIVGIALGIVTGSPERAWRSLLVTCFGIVYTIVLAVAIGSWLATPTLTSTPEIVARTSPTILDLVVALAAGAAGAYGAANRKVSDALAGVAISISLVPPLATVGLLLGQGAYPDALGALLLFMTNFVSIVLAATLVFVLFGVAPIADLMDHQSRTRPWLLTFAAGGLLLVIPLALAFQTTYQQANDEIAATEAVQAWLPSEQDYQILSVQVGGSSVDVELAGPLDPPDLPTLDADLDASLGRQVTVSVRVLSAVTYPTPAP